jgi:L-amino acid N-acyltransferase YncA
VLIRHAEPDRDAAACAAIYAPSVTAGVASLEVRAPEPHHMADRIRIISKDFPWLVAEIGHEVAGYAYASRHRDRASYRWSADVTVYVDAAHHRRGVGHALYRPLLELITRQGFYEACAGITLPNDASVGLHESLGFVPVGVYRDIGYKLGRWRSVGWWQLTLRAHDPDRVPAEPGPPLRLDQIEPREADTLGTPASARSTSARSTPGRSTPS